MNKLEFVATGFCKKIEMQKEEIARKVINKFGYPNNIVICDFQREFRSGAKKIAFQDISSGVTIATMRIDVLSKSGIAEIWLNPDVFCDEDKKLCEHHWEDITTTSDEYTVEICIYCGEKWITKPLPF